MNRLLISLTPESVCSGETSSSSIFSTIRWLTDRTKSFFTPHGTLRERNPNSRGPVPQKQITTRSRHCQSVRPVTVGTRATVSPLPPVYCVDLTFMYLGYEGHCQCFRLCMSVTPGVKLIHQVESLVKNGPFLNGVFTKVLQEAHRVYWRQGFNTTIRSTGRLKTTETTSSCRTVVCRVCGATKFAVIFLKLKNV